MVPALLQLYSSETPGAELPLCHRFKFVATGCLTFQRRSTNRLWRSKQSVFITWMLWGPDISIHMNFLCRSMGAGGLRSIICVLLYMAKDKNYLHNNWMGREYEGLSSILTHTQVAVLQSNSYFLQERKKKISISFSWRYKIHNFDIKQGGWDDIPRPVQLGIG